MESPSRPGRSNDPLIHFCVIALKPDSWRLSLPHYLWFGHHLHVNHNKQIGQKWFDVEKRGDFILSLKRVKILESVPGLIWILENDEREDVEKGEVAI